jgi:glutamate racemase
LSGDVPRLVAEHYLRSLSSEGVDTLVLGCTHYPLLHAAIAEVMGPAVTLVDSAEATAEAAVRELQRRELFAPAGGETFHRAYVTDTPAAFLRVAARFLGHPLASAEQVDLSF